MRNPGFSLPSGARLYNFKSPFCLACANQSLSWVAHLFTCRDSRWHHLRPYYPPGGYGSRFRIKILMDPAVLMLWSENPNLVSLRDTSKWIGTENCTYCGHHTSTPLMFPIHIKFISVFWCFRTGITYYNYCLVSGLVILFTSFTGGLIFSFLLLLSKRFDHIILWASSGVCQSG